jgi:hypothetical protein
MLKQDITYEDYNGDTVTEPFYFNMTKLELLELNEALDGGLEGQLTKLSATTNSTEAYYIFKQIVLDAYGVKSEDGKRFIKSKELTAEFEQSPALSELIISFLQDPDLSAKFVEGVLPAKMVAATKEIQAPPSIETGEKPVTEMTREELLQKFQSE